jgi:hypothetical protein
VGAECLAANDMVSLNTDMLKVPVTHKAPPRLVNHTGNLLWATNGIDLGDGEPTVSPPNYLVTPLFTKGGLDMLVGPSEVGKSWMAMDLVICVATGKNWLVPEGSSSGKGFRTKQTNVVYVDNENGIYRLKRRLKALMRGHETPRPPIWAFASPQPGIDASNEESIRGQLQETILQCNAGLVVVDSLSTVCPGVEENSSDMAGVMTAFRQLTNATGASVLLIHHENKNSESKGSNRIRGSTAIAAGADVALRVERGTERGDIRVSTYKSRDDEIEPFSARIQIKYKQVRCDDGYEVKDYESAKVVGRATAEDARTARTRDEIVTFLIESPDSNGTVIKEKVKDRANVGVNYVDGCIHDLAASGEIMNCGTAQKPKWRVMKTDE